MKRVFQAISLIIILSLVALPSVCAADGGDVELAWKKYSGSGYDIYLPKTDSLAAVELILIVNYLSDPLTLTITGINANDNINHSYYTATIEPKDSQFKEVLFPDMNTTYYFTLSASGNVLFQISKVRAGVYLPPPKDVWRPTAPEGTDKDKEYSESDLISMVRNNFVLALFVVTIVFCFGGIVGIAVKLFTKFLTPKDLLSIMLYLFVISDLSGFPVRWLGDIDRLWYLPFLSGYIFLFFVTSIRYKCPVLIDSAGRTMICRPLVIYYPQDSTKPCIQDQNNRALIRRLLGVHHEIRADGALNDDWYMNVKRPYLPAVRVPVIFVQKSEVVTERVKWRWRIVLKKRVTNWLLAAASALSYPDNMASVESMHRINKQYAKEHRDLVITRLQHQNDSIGFAAHAIEDSINLSPEEAFTKDIEGMDDNLEPIDLEEHVFTEAEAETTESAVSQEKAAADAENQPSDEIKRDSDKSDNEPEPEPERDREKRKRKVKNSDD